MFQKRWDNSEGEIVNGFECWIPPEGYIYDHFNGKLREVGIHRRSRSASEQYWEIIGPPEDYEKRHAKEIKAKANEEVYIDPVCEQWRNEQWLYRLGGFWFYNNGVPTYITAALGMIYATRRREGKTVKSCVAMYEEMSRRRDFRGGIQSKTEDDALKVVFRDGLITPWRHMVDFFCPEYDTRASKRPKDVLRFKDLNSEATAKSSVASAYDGERLDFYIGDEVFKTKVDVRERHNVVVPTLTDEDDEYYGFAMYTSTVEDIDGYVEEYRKLWNESDPTNLNDNGRTESGLFQLFVGAHEARKHDIYGFENVSVNKQFYVNERSAANDARKLASIVRKYPFTIEEAFMSSAGGTLAHLLPVLNQQITNISTYYDDIVVTGDFVWKNGEKDTEVEFIENEGGKFHVLREWVDNFEGGKEYKKIRGMYAPTRMPEFCIGVDPYDHVKTVDDSSSSNGAAYLFEKHNALREKSYRPVVEYLYRDAHPYFFYEDMIKLCVFCGGILLFEDQKPGIARYFTDRKYAPFLMHLPGRPNPGIPSSAKLKQDMVELISVYLLEHCDRIGFLRLLEDLTKFDVGNTQRFDASMAFGYTLISDDRLYEAIGKKANDGPRLELKNFFT